MHAVIWTHVLTVWWLTSCFLQCSYVPVFFYIMIFFFLTLLKLYRIVFEYVFLLQFFHICLCKVVRILRWDYYLSLQDFLKYLHVSILSCMMIYKYFFFLKNFIYQCCLRHLQRCYHVSHLSFSLSYFHFIYCFCYLGYNILWNEMY